MLIPNKSHPHNAPHPARAHRAWKTRVNALVGARPSPRFAGRGSGAAACKERRAMSVAQSIETRGGVAYAAHDGVSLLGDLYLPAGAGPFPALVAAHGGGWQGGARSAFQFWGPYLAARGYVLFAISYRLAKKGQKMFPQAVNDVRAGVQF